MYKLNVQCFLAGATRNQIETPGCIDLYTLIHGYT